MKGVVIFALGLVLAMPSISAGGQEQWVQFRGPSAGDIPDDPSLPDRWSETENIAWKIDVPGLSWSSPVVWNDHVFLTTAISAGDEPAPVKGLYDPGDENGGLASANEHRWMLYDISFETGQIVWQSTQGLRPSSVISRIRSHLKHP